MTIRALTVGRDEHVVFVATALARMGVPMECVSLSELARSPVVCVGILPDDAIALAETRGRPNHLYDRARVTWVRRMPPGVIPPDMALAPDIPFIKRSYRTFTEHLLQLADDSFCINSPRAKHYTCNKISQLFHAREVGLLVPPTIVTNAPDDVRAFQRRYGAIIVKPLVGYAWQNESFWIPAATARLDTLSSIEDDAIRLAPHIYQPCLEKSFEARITMFGRFVCASRIDSRALNDAGQLDWRADTAYRDTLSPLAVPEGIIASLRALMRALGIKFGTFDFIINDKEEYVFVEVNESGQFLWQEQFCPESVVLQPFAEYLQCGSDDYAFDARNTSKELSLASVIPEALASDFGRTTLLEPVDVANRQLTMVETESLSVE